MSPKKLAIIASKGTLDAAYPAFLLALTGAALGYECRMYFSFGGLHLLKREIKICLSPIGNPALPSRMPVMIRFLPGVQALFTKTAEERMQAKGLASLETMRQLCIEEGITMYACQMSAELLGCLPKDLIPHAVYGGAATFFDFAGESDICLFT